MSEHNDALARAVKALALAGLGAAAAFLTNDVGWVVVAGAAVLMFT